MGEQEPTQKLGAYILKEAGLKASEIDKLQQMPWKEYYELAQSAAAKLNEEARNSGNTVFVPALGHMLMAIIFHNIHSILKHRPMQQIFQ